MDRGGPSKGAIHNKTGDDYKGLIKAWAQHTGGVTRKVRQVSESPYAALIDRIEKSSDFSVTHARTHRLDPLGPMLTMLTGTR